MNALAHRTPALRLAAALCAILVCIPGLATAAIPPGTPLVARVEMRIGAEDVGGAIHKGDLLTLVEEREDDFVIQTHDGTLGAVDKVNAVQIPESVNIYDELIEEHPDDGRYYTLRASAHWALGKSEAALSDFDQAIEKGYEQAHAFTSRGLFRAEMGQFDEAIEDYDHALKIDPESISPIINRAAVHMHRGDYGAAVADYTAVLEARPEAAKILHQRAIAHKAGGNIESALKDFATIIKNNPEDRTAIMGRGYLHFQTGDHAAAIEDFSKAIDMNPQDAVAWNNRGYNRAAIGELETALADYDRAIELVPQYALAHQNRAWALITADSPIADPKAALGSAQRAAELNNHEVVGDLSALAAAYAANENFPEAIGWQEKVVEQIGEDYRPLAEKILQRYREEKPFVADLEAEERPTETSADDAPGDSSKADSTQKDAATTNDSGDSGDSGDSVLEEAESNPPTEQAGEETVNAKDAADSAKTEA